MNKESNMHYVVCSMDQKKSSIAAPLLHATYYLLPPGVAHG